MKKHHLIIIAVFVAVITSMLTAFVYYSYNIYKIEEIKVDYNITGDNLVGINLDRDAVHFGRLYRNSTAEREINVFSDRDAVIYSYAIGIENIYIIPAIVSMLANETINLKVVAVIPENASLGYYDGKIRIVARRK